MFDKFVQWAEKEYKTRLTPLQFEAAKALLTSQSGQALFSAGIGAGKTFLLKALEDFSHEHFDKGPSPDVNIHVGDTPPTPVPTPTPAAGGASTNGKTLTDEEKKLLGIK